MNIFKILKVTVCLLALFHFSFVAKADIDDSERDYIVNGGLNQFIKAENLKKELKAKAANDEEYRNLITTQVVPLWLESAEKGTPVAMFQLGVYNLYGSKYGWNDKIDKDQARQWMIKAWKRGYGPCYADGYLSELGISDEEALTMLRESAENGDDEAQIMLGLYYALGSSKLVGNQINLPESKKYYEMAAAKGRSYAMLRLAYQCYDAEQHIFGPDFKHWAEKAALAGWPDGMFLLASYYAHTHEFLRAIEWYRKAAENGSEEAAEALRDARLQ